MNETIMKLVWNDKTLMEITTNRSMTVEEAIYSYGYDVDCYWDLQRAYDNNEPFVYMDDDGIICVDWEYLWVEY